MMNKKVLFSIVTLGIMLSAAGYSASKVLADSQNPMHDTLVTRLAEKFNLNESEVEAVFTAVRDEKMAEMEQKREDGLNEAVGDGVITEDQKNAILSKMQEHKDQMHQDRNEMHTWFSEQGIDETKLHEYLGGFGGPRGHRGEW